MRLCLLKDPEVKTLAETVKKQEGTLKEVFELLKQVKKERGAKIKFQKSGTHAKAESPCLHSSWQAGA